MSVVDACKAVVKAEKNDSLDFNKQVRALQNSYSYAQKKPNFGYPTNLKASMEKELALVATCLSFEREKAGIRPSELIEEARNLFGESADWDGWGWLHRFMNRHSDQLKTMSPEAISIGRVNQNQKKTVPMFLDDLERIERETAYSKKTKFNCDEIILGIKAGKLDGRRITAQERTKGLVAYQHGSSVGAAINFIDAVNHRFMTVIILKVTNINESAGSGRYKGPILRERRMQRGEGPIFYAFNSTGMMNADLWLSVLQKFKELCELMLPSLHVLVFLDNLASHRSFDSLRYAKANNIRLCFLPPNTTHYLQPLDQFVYGEFKREIVMDLRFSVSLLDSSVRWKSVMLIAVSKAITRAFTGKIIEASWLVVGLEPYSRKTILERMNQNVAGPTITDTVIKTATEACQNIIQQKLKMLDDSGIEDDDLDVVVPLNYVVDGYELFRLQLKQTEEKEKAAEDSLVMALERQENAETQRVIQQQQKEKAAQDRLNKSRQDEWEKEFRKFGSQCQTCGKKWVGRGLEWVVCECCDMFTVCGECYAKEIGREKIDTHELDCKGLFDLLLEENQ